MIVRTLKEITGTERDKKAANGNWVSRRFLLAKDGMDFSFHETTIFAGTETRIWYKNHLEAVYCVGGKGELERLDTGEIIPISDGTMYALNGHEPHLLRASEDMRLVCVFNPALVGTEDHNKDGVYATPEEETGKG
ncbi:ectoine synthase [Desulfobotulus mexicanus]|uniref:L-ectoine synthase n=1 Tax=Desulfobotulus mexicanus TaxID=2586642 RepID=A0A5Q4VEB3_9BACT|nr:ectoine synthase [Desulfobotulus mexicanus]TYT75985.1 ectoine synthase [Desulfobotulus mexicanus]